MPSIIINEFGGLAVLGRTERCSTCGYHVGLDRAVFSCDDKLQYRYSIFQSSDGFHVANNKFRVLAIESGFTGVEFVPLKNGYFVIRVARKVKYDLTTGRVTQEGWCPDCQNYRRSLTMPGSHALDGKEALIEPLGVVETQHRWGVEVGERVAQTTDLIVGDEAARVIAAANFRGVEVCEQGSVKRR